MEEKGDEAHLTKLKGKKEEAEHHTEKKTKLRHIAQALHLCCPSDMCSRGWMKCCTLSKCQWM